MLDRPKMPTAAPHPALPIPRPCPTDEEIAAYIDGNLDGPERERVTGHLASCEDCYAVYSETARFLTDSSPVIPEEDAMFDDKVVSFPSRTKFVARWGSLAALLLLGIGGGASFYLLKPPPALPTGDLTASLPQPQGGSQWLWLGPTYRNAPINEPAEDTTGETPLRLGVQLVNLQMNLRAGRVQESQDVVARVLGLLNTQFSTEDLRKGYTAITIDLANGRTPAQVLPRASRLALETREAVDATSFDLGQWVEAGRLAATSRNPSFFRRTETRRFLQRLLWRDRLGVGETRLDPPTRESLWRISEILGKGDLQASDYALLGRQLDEILKIHYAM
jgi:hypothetical protein